MKNLTNESDIARIRREEQVLRDMYNLSKIPAAFVEILCKQCPEHAEMLRAYHGARCGTAISIAIPA